MPILQVRNLPAALYKRLGELAAREHRSLARQTVILLEKALAEENDAPKRRREMMAQFRRHPIGKARGKAFNPTDWVRTDRER